MRFALVEKIALAPRQLLALALVVIAALGVVIVLVASPEYATTTLRTPHQRFTLQIADTSQTREQGLSDRPSLPTTSGMLFFYPDSAVRCLWMRRMRFPLDMVWLNAHKQVVHIESNVSPASFPHKFCPPQLAQYVIELPAGQAMRAGIQLGHILQF